MEEPRERVQEEGFALIIDSNVLFTIIIAGKRSRAYRVIEKYELNLFMPEEALIEFHKHVEKLKRYSLSDFEVKSDAGIYAHPYCPERAL